MTKQTSAKALLDKIRLLVKRHRESIANKINIDEPAVPRNDHNGNKITSKTGHGSYHHDRRSTKRQFMKVHSEDIDDTRKEPGEGSDKIKKKKKARTKTSEIVMNPDEENYGNCKNVKTANEDLISRCVDVIREQQKLVKEFVDENGEYGGGDSEQTRHFRKWHKQSVQPSSTKFTSHADVYNNYKKHAEQSGMKPLPMTSRDYGKCFESHMRQIGGHVPTVESWPVTLKGN